ncbi:hypothetical protein BSR28_08135 [Boudabousia liubingyangii]|uniref:YraN family protein n=1 Tax=Boudabousia liubingyangii TaxID=1921764 RepID=UPI00093ED533|nr:YraN family protein [Boudabousia liubingyangii]OKL46480.1 hypothetical protein BSR28_08135 [Boudabousia liubingyangii]
MKYQRVPKHNQKVGALGEELAARVLTKSDWKIVDRNWNCKYGEIDLIAERSGALAFVEVKTRLSTGSGSGAGQVNARKIRNLKRAISTYLEQEKPSDFYRLQMLVCEVHFCRNNPIPQVSIYRIEGF